MRKILFLFLFFVVLASPALAEDCPFGVTNDPAPGDCRLYTDRNGNDYCDYGEPAKSAVQAPAISSAIQADGKEKNVSSGSYLLPLTLAFIILQAILLAALKFKKISALKLKKINNWFLLILFLAVAVSSAPFLIRDAGLAEPSGLRTWSLLHTDSGWLMILFSLEHVVRRWWFFKIGLNKKEA